MAIRTAIKLSYNFTQMRKNMENLGFKASIFCSQVSLINLFLLVPGVI